MLKNRTVPFLIGAVVLAVVVAADGLRTKRQAPSINVHNIPKTSFSCLDRKVGEYYADPESFCQVYHVCVPGMHNKLSLISFVCPNGTIFSQATKVCTPYDRVDCSLTNKFYENGELGTRRDFMSDDYDNFVPQPQSQPPRPPAPSRSRTTPAPTTPTPTPRNNRFRSNQFRGQQGQAASTAAPVRTTVAPPQIARAAPPRPAAPAFRSPVIAARPPQAPARPTPRAVVSTSTSNFNYEYEYEYDYEDETPAAEQGNARSKRDIEGKLDETSFTCEDKVPGGAYADVESKCEMFHICVLLGKSKILDYKVYCANGTAFDQETGSCRERDEFVCENAQQFYQFEKQNQPKSNKKPVASKKKYYKAKKIASKE